MRRDGRTLIKQIANDADKAAKTGNMKAVFDTTGQFCNRPYRTDSVRRKEGNLLPKEEEVKKEYFAKVLNGPAPTGTEAVGKVC